VGQISSFRRMLGHGTHAYVWIIALVVTALVTFAVIVHWWRPKEERVRPTFILWSEIRLREAPLC
jgi:hypothetical protein